MNRQRKAIIEANKVSTVEEFILGGYPQKVLIEGKTKDLPVVITLHGGPGSPIPFCVGARGLFPEFTDKCILVSWDQYGCGINNAKLPDDMPAGTALSALDVAGAPAQAARLVQSGQKVLVIGGGGKSGLLCLYEAKKRAGVTGLVVCAAGSQKSEDRARNLDLADVYFHMDATDAVGMYEKAMELTNGELFDVVINCVSIENTEMASILCTKDRGTVYFFSMATSFTKAALGAEGVGKDVTMIMGNGYAKGHAEITLQVLREHEGIRKLFEEMYA